MEALREFQHLDGQGGTPPRRLFSGQHEGETDEEFFCRQRAMQSAAQLARRDCSPGGPVFFKDAPVGSRSWNRCVEARYQMHARRFIEACEKEEEAKALLYYQSARDAMTAGGKVPSPFDKRRGQKPQNGGEEGMKPFTGGKLPPSGVWPLTPVEEPPPTLKAGFVQKRPAVILPVSAPGRQARPVVTPFRSAMDMSPRSSAPRTPFGPQAGVAAPMAFAARTAPAARARSGVSLSGLTDRNPGEWFYVLRELGGLTLGFLAGYWLMTDLIKKGHSK